MPTPDPDPDLERIKAAIRDKLLAAREQVREGLADDSKLMRLKDRLTKIGDASDAERRRRYLEEAEAG